MSLRHEPEQMPVAIKTPGASVFQDLQALLVMPVEKFVCDAAGRRFVCQLKSLRAKPLHADDGYDLIRENSPDRGGWLEIFEASHVLRGRKLKLVGSIPDGRNRSA
jgi:hypothetical protein